MTALLRDQAVRHARQILVHGAGAQAAIERSTAPVGGEGRAHAWATLYATRAGFAAVAPGSIDREALAPTPLLGSDAARDLLAASRAVLTAMRRAADDAKRGSAP